MAIRRTFGRPIRPTRPVRRWSSTRATGGVGDERAEAISTAQRATKPASYYNPYRQNAPTQTSKFAGKPGAGKSDLMKLNATQQFTPPNVAWNNFLGNFQTVQTPQTNTISQQIAQDAMNRQNLWAGGTVPTQRRIGGEQYNPSAIPPTLRTGETWKINGQLYKATQLSDYSMISKPSIGLRGADRRTPNLPPGAIVRGSLVFVPVNAVQSNAYLRESTSPFLKSPSGYKGTATATGRKGYHPRVEKPRFSNMPLVEQNKGNQGVLPPLDTGGSGGGGGYYPEPWFPPIGGGSGTYSSLSPYAQYQRGAPAQGAQAQGTPQVATAGVQQRAGANPTLYPARWMQLLTNWRI